MQIIDVNAAAGFWPIQCFTDRTPAELNGTFASQDIDEVWLSAIESILFPEPDTHDLALLRQIESFPRFRPVKTVNPTLANWHASVDAMNRRHPLAAVKLFPNYHGYSLQSSAMRDVCAMATQLSLPILIQMRLNDERNQPAFLQVPGVSAQEIARLSHSFPDNLIIALCAYGGEVPSLSRGSSNLLLDFSFLDGCDAVGPFADVIRADRFVFGSHAPFLHVQSARMKLSHFELPEPLRRGIANANLLTRLNTRTTVPAAD